MSERPGAPVWFELTSADRDAIQPFYAAVAGWRVVDDPDPAHGGYRIAMAGDKAVAGLMAPMMPDQPTGWGVYFAGDDIDAAARRIAELGGIVLFGPTDIPGVGRFLVANDPQGVRFNLVRQLRDEPRAFQPMPEDGADGHGVWVELASPDPDGAFAFYGAFFGWTKAGAMPMGAMGEYAFIGTGDVSADGAQSTGPGAIMSSAATGAPPAWNWYVHVPDIDAAVDSAKAAGGALIQGPDEIPGGAFSANLLDPQRHAIGIVGSRRS